MPAPPRRALFSAAPPRVCAIAGSDSGGGAGIQADLKTAQAIGAYGLSVVTALTAQNTRGVGAIHAVPPAFVRQQLAAVRADIAVDAWKVGMLADAAIIGALGEELRSGGGLDAPLVLDPVMVSTSGSLLLTHDSIAALVESLLPLCTVLTPNLPEARQLLRHARSSTSTAQASSSTTAPDDPLATLRSLIDAARELCALGPAATLVKGGHHVMRRAQIEEGLRELGVSLAPGFAASEGPAHAGPFAPASALQGAEISHGSLALDGVPAAGLTLVRTDGQPWSDVLRRWYATGAQSAKDDPDAVVVDVLYETAHAQPRYTLFIKPHIDSSATHGTGCTLSSAIATYLAAGLSVREATGLGIAYVQASLARGLPDLGSGPGPLNHASNVCPRGVLAPAALGSATDRVPFCARLIANSLRDWQGYTQHEFVRQIASRTLPRDAFVWFLKQDYIFLRHYARVWARGAASAVVGRTFADIALFAGMAGAMANEAQTHVRLCARWGISLQELELGTRESAATLAYTRYVLDVANGGDALDLLAATAPCVLGYAEVGLWLASQRAAPQQASEDDAAYEEWIETYAGDEFQEVVRKSIESMEQRAAADTLSPLRVARLQQIWNAATRLEVGMWDEALDPRLRREIVDAEQ